MSREKKLAQIVNTPSRMRLSKKIGDTQLGKIEEMILKKEQGEVSIIETPARVRLREKLGQAELDRIESAIMDSILRSERLSKEKQNL
jgi:hypothetical protein